MMIYQESLKNEAALWYNVQPKILHEMPYKLWAIIRDQYLKEVTP